MNPHPKPQSQPSTRATLLSKVRDGADADAWRQFDETYRDMLRRFCRSLGIQPSDADDILQVVFLKLAKALREFQYDPSKGRFRDYLFRCIRSAISDWKSRPTPRGSSVVLDEMIVLPENELTTVLEGEWVAHHYRLALAHLRTQVEERSIQVLEATLAGRGVADIACDLNMSEPAVYKVRQRLKERLRQTIEEQVRAEEDVGV